MTQHPFAADLRFFSTGSVSSGIKSPAEEAQAVVKQENQIQQQALYGSPDVQKRLATAQTQGNLIGQDQGLLDINGLDTAEFAAKYGIDDALSRGSYSQALRELTEFKARERSTKEAVKDTAISAATAAGGLAGGVATLGALGVDQALAALPNAVNALAGQDVMPKAPALSPIVSKGVDWLTDAAREQQSDLLNSRRAQHALEDQLNQEDRSALAARDAATGSDNVVDYFRDKGRAFYDTIANYADDPMLIGDKVPEAIGSVAGFSGIIRSVAKTALKTQLKQQGRSADEIAAFLKLPEGKAALAAKSEAVAPMVIGGVEAGSSAGQTQTQIMAMDAEDLVESQEYLDLRAKGLSHEAARSELALNAGTMAALVAAPGAILAGKIAAPFATNPLAVGSLGSAVGNVARETVEEALQGANSQAATNLGLSAGAGLDVALDAGVVEAGAEGVISGALSAGPLQAVGLAGSGVNAVTGAVAAGTKRMAERASREIEAADPVGQAARNAAIAPTLEAGTQLAASLVTGLDTPNQSTPQQELSGKLNKALYLDDQEASAYGALFGVDQRTADGRITRQSFIETRAKTLSSAEASAQDKLISAVDILSSLDDMRKLKSDALAAAAQDEASQASLAQLRSSLDMLESSAVRKAAVDQIASLTQESVKELVPLHILSDEAASPEQKKGITDIMTILTAANPALLTQNDYDVVLNQITPSGVNDEQAKSLRTSKVMAEIIEDTDTSIALIMRDVKAAKGRTFRSWDSVRDDILATNNKQNGLLSLPSHYRAIKEAAEAGRVEDAVASLEDLQNFAKSQMNKMAAFNKAVETDTSDAEKGIQYEAFGPFDFFLREQGAWFQKNSPNSVALVREIHADVRATVNAYNGILAEYGAQLSPGTLPLAVPALSSKLVGMISSPLEGEASLTKERRIRKDAVLKLKDSLVDVGQFEKRPKAPAAARIRPPSKRPFTALLKKLSGGIDPKGWFGQELAAAGVNAANTPGLFHKSGRDRLDNLVASEAGEYAYLVEADGNGYFSEQALIDAVAEELNGPPIQDSEQMNRVAAQEARDAKTPKPAATEAPNVQTKKAEPEAEASTEGDTQEPITEPVAVEGTAQSTEAGDDTADEPVAAADTGEPASVAWFGDLKARLFRGTAQGINYFAEAFGPSKNGSTFTKNASPSQFILENLETLKVGNESRQRTLLAHEKTQLHGMMQDELPKFRNELASMIRKTVQEKGYFGAAKADKNFLAFSEGQVLNFLAQNAEGKVSVDPVIVEATYMATMEWLMENAGKGKASLSTEQISKMYGLGRNGFVTTEMAVHARSGAPMQSVIQDIAGKIETLLGVKANNTVSASRTQGLITSLAANGLEIFLKGGEIQRADLGYADAEGQPSTLTTLSASEQFKDGQVPKDMTLVRDVFTQLFTPYRTKARYIGAAPTEVARTQLGNRLAKLSKLERAVVERLQNIPHFVDEGMLGLMQALGEDGYKRLLGYAESTTGKTHKATAQSRKGKNQSLDHAWEEILGYVDEMVLMSDRTGNETELGKLAMFFEYAISSVGRAQQQGRITPQGSKEAREVLTSTWSTVDFSNEDHQRVFWLAVAQSMGVGIEKQSHAKSVVEIQDMMTNQLGEAVALLEEHVKGGDLDVEAFEAATSGIEMTPKAMHALLTVAQANLVRGTKGETAFRTSLAIEADGKTDGPVNAMIHMMTGMFDAEQIKRLAKGGLFFTSQKLSLSEFMELEGQRSHEKHKDLYASAAEIFRTKLEKLYSRSGNSADMGNILQLLHSFLDGFAIGKTEDGKSDVFDIARSVTKNPLTVFLYGSGVDGIAGKISSAVLDAFYQRLTDNLEGKLTDAFSDSELVTLEAVFGKDNLNKLTAAPTEFELSKVEFARLQEQIVSHFADPMLEAIDEATGGLATNMKELQAASQIQTYVFQAKLMQGLATKRAARIASKELLPTEELSENDMNEVFTDIMRLAPIYKTNAQEFHISKQAWVKAMRESTKEKTDKAKASERVVSTSLTGKLRTVLEVMTGQDASVKVSPFMTIGTGDGRMILNLFEAGVAVLQNALPVFDGVEMGIAEATEASDHINAAVFKGWMDSNIYQGVADGFEQLLTELDQATLDSLPMDIQKSMSRALKLRSAVQVADIVGLQQRLVNNARSVDARKHAMNQLATQTDHMASLMAPSANGSVKTRSDDALDFEGIAQKLNELADAYGAEAKEARKTERLKPAVQAPTAALSAMIESNGEPVNGHERVRRLTGSQLVAHLKKDPDLSREQKTVLYSILDKEGLADSTYYFGNEKDLTDMRGDLYPDIQGRIKLGQYSTHAGGVTFITNEAPETVLHEMLHSHTFRTLRAHYKDPGSSASHVTAAVTELEKLMQTTYDMRYSDPALDTLKTVLAQLAGKPDQQMTEFLSWALTNQRLIELGKRKRVYAGLADTVRKVLEGLKKLLGIKQGPGETLFSNIRFNTEILVSLDPANAVQQARDAVEDEAVLDQTYPVSLSVSEVEERFGKRLLGYLTATKPDGNLDPKALVAFTLAVSKLEQSAKASAAAAISAGYVMNAREQLAYETVHAAMMSGMQLDAGLIRQANMLYGQVLKEVSAADFMRLRGPNANPGVAQSKVDFLIDAGGLLKAGEKSDLLASFVALGMVNSEFQDVLSELQVPKALELKRKTFDDVVRSLGSAVVELLTRMSFNRARLSQDGKQELTYLAARLSETQIERKGLATNVLMSAIDKGNDWSAKKLRSGVNATVEYLENKATTSSNRAVKAVLPIGMLIASVGSKDKSGGSLEFVGRLLDAAPGLQTAREFMNEMVGMTKGNAETLRMINPVRTKVDAVRQAFREQVPEELAKSFKKKRTDDEWSSMTKGVAQMDMLVLGRQRAAEMLASEPKRAAEIARLEKDLTTEGGNNAALYREKINALATWMAKGELITDVLQRNAHAIAHLFGEGVQATVTPKLETIIDELVSLRAYEMQPKEIKDTIADLLGSEKEGMARVFGLLAETRQAEIDRAMVNGAINPVARNNGWKGYVPSVAAPGAKIIVADDTENKRLLLEGYVRVGNYLGDPAENYIGKRGYYQSTVGGSNAFRQGIAQTIHTTWQGVDARTGRSHLNNTAGSFMGKRALRISKSIAKAGSKNTMRPSEGLLPLYDFLGNVMGYEGSMDQAKLNGLQRDTHLGRMLGVWTGRIAEETVAEQFNTDLLKVIKRTYDDQKQDPKVRFVNVADKSQSDPIIRDAWNALGWKIKQDAAAIFGPDFLPVRADLVNDTIGYRAPGVADLWTGISRWSLANQARIKGMLIAIGGVRTFERLKQAETIVEGLVSHAKTTIVVRSVRVGLDNLLGNILHLGGHGIGPLAAAKSMREKYIETVEYVKNLEDIGKLKIERASYASNSAEARRLTARITALKAANDNLSIAPLIKAGEFSTISENLDEADVAIREGNLFGYFENALEKLPGWAPTVAKNLVITKDTALFKGMSRFIQYGDFVAKAVLYDHLTKKGKQSEREILDLMFEEFVPYNRLAGRARDGIESVGLLWFWKYKVRIQKVALNMIRDRPLSALMVMGGAGPLLEVNTLDDGALVGAALQGNLGYSFGPEMGFNAPGMNPWYAIMG